MEGIDGIVDALARALGLEGASLLAALAVISLVARLVGKTIPDDVTGWKGVVRDVCKVIGLYVSNRVTSKVSVTDVAKVLVESKLPIRDEAGKFTSTSVLEAAREK